MNSEKLTTAAPNPQTSADDFSFPSPMTPEQIDRAIGVFPASTGVVPQKPPAGLRDYPVPRAMRSAWQDAGLAELPLADQFLAARALLSPPRAAPGKAPDVLLSGDFCQRLYPELRSRRAGCGARRLALVEASADRLRSIGLTVTVAQEQVYAHHEDRARAAKHAVRVTISGWGAELENARRGAVSAAARAPLGEMVLLIGGQRYDVRRQRAYRAQVVAEAVERIEEAAAQPWCADGLPGHAHVAAMHYFCAALTPSSMAIPAERWEEALALVPPPPSPLPENASAEERSAYARAWSRRMSIMRALHEFRLCPEAPPTPSRRGRTTRITSPMTGLPADIRRVLRPDLWGLDGAAMHLALAAARWNCPEMQTYLVGCQQAGVTIWQAMADDIATHTELVIDAAAAKKHLKILTYSLAYGKGRRALRLDAQERMALLVPPVDGESDDELDELPERLVNAYLALAPMRALLDARDRQMDRIQRDRGLTTVMGRRCDLPFFEDRADLRAEIRSILATDLQDAEQLLFAPIYELAAAELRKTSPRMRIVCPTHDGMLVWLDRCEDAWIARVERLYLDACARMGVVGTRLTVDPPRRETNSSAPLTSSAPVAAEPVQVPAPEPLPVEEPAVSVQEPAAAPVAAVAGVGEAEHAPPSPPTPLRRVARSHRGPRQAVRQDRAAAA